MRKCTESSIKTIAYIDMERIKKWFDLLDFPQEFQEEFYREIVENKISLPDALTVNELAERKDFRLNLVYCLAECEKAVERFISKGIPEQYFRANAREIVVEAIQCRKNYGMLGIDDIRWVDLFLRCERIFRIGCLNFDMEIAGEHGCEGGNIRKDDSVVLVHIPSDGRLDSAQCVQSFRDAEIFFAKYFPEFTYKCFVCGSWLLDDGLGAFLDEKSNILAFQKLFTLYKKEESRSLIRYVFSRTTTPDNISEFPAKNSLQRQLRDYIVKGGKTYEGFGTRERCMK